MKFHSGGLLDLPLVPLKVSSSLRAEMKEIEVRLVASDDSEALPRLVGWLGTYGPWPPAGKFVVRVYDESSWEEPLSDRWELRLPVIGLKHMHPVDPIYAPYEIARRCPYSTLHRVQGCGREVVLETWFALGIDLETYERLFDDESFIPA